VDWRSECSARRSAKNSSTCCTAGRHGISLVNPRKRRTSFSRLSIAREREIACQLLAAPAGQHLLQHLICGLQVANTRQLDDPPHVVNSHRPAPQVRSLDDRN